MKKITKDIQERIGVLNTVIKEKRIALKDAPRGVINVVSLGERAEYYWKEKSSDTIKHYLGKKERDLVAALCQKEYDERILQTAERELKQLTRFYKIHEKPSFEDVYKSLNIHRKKLIVPVVCSDEEFVREWEQQEYVQKEFRYGAPEFYTDKGERVRSKTEILIANALHRYGVPYRYECPLYLEEAGTIHPDFTVLNVRTRKEYYWEHMGMMDHPEYAEEALRRILIYEKNGIYPGENLILTHETSSFPINSKGIDGKILRYLV